MAEWEITVRERPGCLEQITSCGCLLLVVILAAAIAPPIIEHFQKGADAPAPAENR